MEEEMSNRKTYRLSFSKVHTKDEQSDENGLNIEKCHLTLQKCTIS